MSREQRRRLDSLIKQAVAALNSASEERLNLDCDSRSYLDSARQAVQTFDFIVSSQPVKPTV
jgi:hypothetical protein